MSAVRPTDAGFALAAVLLLLVGLTGLAHAGLVLSAAERRASLLEARLIQRRLAARTAARPPHLDDTLPILGGVPTRLSAGAVPPLRWRTDAIALGPELALLSGVAELDGLAPSNRAPLVSRSDPWGTVQGSAGRVTGRDTTIST